MMFPTAMPFFLTYEWHNENMKLNMRDHLAWFKKDNMILKAQENPTRNIFKKLIQSPKIIPSKIISWICACHENDNLSKNMKQKW